MMIENLESHLRVSKEERKPREVCDLCESRFELKSDLKVHVRTQHQRCKASQCDEGLVPNQQLQPYEFSDKTYARIPQEALA